MLSPFGDVERVAWLLLWRSAQRLHFCQRSSSESVSDGVGVWGVTTSASTVHVFLEPTWCQQSRLKLQWYFKAYFLLVCRLVPCFPWMSCYVQRVEGVGVLCREMRNDWVAPLIMIYKSFGCRCWCRAWLGLSNDPACWCVSSFVKFL